MIDKLRIEGAQICSKNFSGTVGPYNPTGRRQFTVILDEETAKSIIAEGWNVKEKPGREEGDPPRYFLDVMVKFAKFPPVIKQVTKKGITTLDEDTCGCLDGATLTNVDLVITPYNWEFNGKTGIKAYLKTGYFTLEEDEFADKYML